MGLHCTHTRGLDCIAFCIFFICILEEPVASAADKVSYEVCTPHHCGGNHRVSISYPFYIPGGGRELCGYPGFEVSCEGTKTMYGHYSVKSISYEENSVDLAIQGDTSCFAPYPFTYPPINIFLNKSSFLHPNLWFFINCTSSSSFSFPTSPVKCPSNATYNTSVALLPNGTFPRQNGSCGLISGVPVQLEGGLLNRTIKNVTYKELLKKGFRLKWDLLTMKSCAGCEKSGGRCGRSQYTDFLCYCPHGTDHPKDCKKGGGKLKARSLLKKGALGASISAFGVAIIVLAYLCRHKISKHKPMIIGSRKMKKSHKFEVNFENHGILVTRSYSHADIKRMTNSFKEKLGEGGYGCVYKGKLPDGLLVAVKILSKLKGDGEDFINEVNSMSRTSHVNIVKLLGFCFHKTKRALVYEYMPNGSLEKLIYEENYFKLGCSHLGWGTLYQISLGIAHGLEYLHKGCNSRILHFDIKPHNILLDENYCPKISDFGLAKICHREKSTISLLGARGTAGFIAPEVFCRNIGGISQKSDVYSFGMTMLEMVGGRKNIMTGAKRTSEIYFPHWIHKRLELQEELGLQNVTSEGDKEKAEKMVIVGLWCIQTNPSIRPTMSEVVDMLRGGVDCLQVPPKPYLSSPSRSSPTTSMSMVV
ncbi:LEAF RUST 10 DISEASE-RESISTANCE LOCUS RECEPTOR-LIKE PROTEIN KINASE-like 2.4 isoform X4 [Eucalyptus grandis]|uniref:LEAF RUST 10 DISEASE-RESISTANCE LOCUS RECEPTOR-LIKE PROTEIN KINASE-like 2.4 isoform X4 n=1 Tax=Eucalyptus grandis TaxID=71139 RepID=UPI00192EB07E|nr:LEAF RUST 10 DISEASE-RESISTANCE LOCUS RECEPTOR-LIKE PROTEIN KINASE-like 2.4 isoform X4 [Eucalyptus grandis]